MNTTKADVAPGKPYWKAILAEGPEEWQGKHSIFVDVWDERGNRIPGVPVTLWWNGGQETKNTEKKTGEPFAMDFPMYAAGEAYGVRVGDGLPSDQVYGMGLIAWHSHVVYKVIFQRTVAEGTVTPPAPTPPSKPSQPSKDKYQLYRNGVLVYESE